MLNSHEPQNPEGQGILDTVSFQEHSAAIRTFNPQSAVLDYLQKVPSRERQVIIDRYGLADGKPLTLEVVGKKLNLTRERVRQIEKEVIKKLNNQARSVSLTSGIDLIYQIIEDRGNIARESVIMEIMLTAQNSLTNQQALVFLLRLTPQFNLFKETPAYNAAWFMNGFDKDLLDQTITAAKKLFTERKQPLKIDDLAEALAAEAENSELAEFNHETLEGYLSISKELDKAPFEQWGLSSWPEIHPKDAGDKAYLVLLHHGKPEHYSKITELINKQKFDERLAHKESVHNVLIKDRRFVLIGRGIYALAEWGYKTGVVADIISEILKGADQPLGRDDIIAEVLKQRMVKRNTIIVGLSNKNRFRKAEDGKYANA